MSKQLKVINPNSHHDTIARELTRDPDLGSPLTRTNYLADLDAFEDWQQNRLLTKLLVEEYASHLRNDLHLAASTVNRRLSAVRWWAKRLAEHAHENPDVDKELRDEIIRHAERVATVENVKGAAGQRGRHLSDGELASLLRACTEDDSPAGVRDAAMIALAWASGARRAEIATAWMSEMERLDAENIDLVLHGKGDKVRMARLSGGAAWALADWQQLRGSGDGFVFCAIYRSGRMQIDHGLSTQSLAVLLEKRRLQAGVAPMAWHDFRRTFAGNLLSANVDISTVQKLMGHSSPITTAIYDVRGAEIQRAALGKLHVPYTQRALLPARKVKK